jgi:hypothetical protein
LNFNSISIHPSVTRNGAEETKREKNPVMWRVLIIGWLLSAAITASPTPEIQDREDPAELPELPEPETPPPPSQGAAINHANTTVAAPVPIKMQLFAGSAGPKTCRGSPMVNMVLPKNVSSDPTFTQGNGQCYELPAISYCAIFTGNKEDGCEAKLFSGEKCTAFVNLAVFLPEARTMGGVFKSMQVKCGIVPVEPPPLSLGGLGGKKKPT